MKLTINRKLFSEAFSIAASVAATKDTKPLLCNVLLDATREPVSLSATDSEVSIQIDVAGCEIEEPGKAMLSKSLVKSIVAEVKAEKINIEHEGDNLSLSAQWSSFELPTMPPDEFPQFATDDLCKPCFIGASMLKTMIQRTAFATDEFSTKYSLGGVYFDLSDSNGISLVGTDGRRLAHSRGHSQWDADKGLSPIVPKKSLSLMERCFPGGDIAFSRHETMARFRGAGAVISTRLVEGRFPRWKNIIPDTEGWDHIEIVSEALESATKQAKIVTNVNKPGVDFCCNPGMLLVGAMGADIGKSTAKVPVSYSGPKTTFCLDPDYVVDFLKQTNPTDAVKLYFKKDQAVYFQIGEGYEYIIMPITPDKPTTKPKG